MKRAFDILIALMGIVLFMPVFSIITVISLLTSKGPILFKQIRVGFHGKYFRIYKFRTMVENADSQSGISINYDPRVTRFGRILRATKLDELPQLYNVLKGNMSIIGPRPELPEISENYYQDKFEQITTVRPGIVGPAQIIGRNEEDMMPSNIENAQDYYIKFILPDKLKVDLDYVKNPTLRTDIKLLFIGVKETLLGLFKPSYLQKSGKLELMWIDGFSILLSYCLAYCFRFEWQIPDIELWTLVHSLPIVLSVRIFIFHTFKLYNTFYKYISIQDLLQLIRACLASTALIVILIFFSGLQFHSRTIFLIDLSLLILMMSGVRVSLRLLGERRVAQNYTPYTNVLIIGAGDIGEMLVRDISKNGGNYRVVGFVDDDPLKIGSTLHGINVYGDRKDIPDIAKMLHVDEILIAIGRLSAEEMRSILGCCEKSKVKHRIVPAVEDLISGAIHLSKIREVDISDILGREPLKLSLGSIKSFITGKKILLTGAGGSIGSELTRQIIQHNPAQLLLIDRNENYLFELESELNGACKQFKTDMIFKIADIKNTEKIETIFKRYEPQIIFHTAAQKHVPLSELNPDEAIRNNIFGTMVVAMMSHKYQAEYFTLISTDKAVNPTSVMGATKRIAELWTRSFSEKSATNFITVRFGNVINSHGSVIPLFMKQIQNGGPITITDSNITRFFMSIPEAVNLILQAVVTGNSGDIYILDMGKSIKIETMAIEMIKQVGLKPGIDIKINYTGLRPGEKLYEELTGQNEIVLPTDHDMIRKITQKSVNNFQNLNKKIHMLLDVCHSNDNMVIIDSLKSVLPEYKPNLSEESVAKKSQRDKEVEGKQVENLSPRLEMA